MMFEENKVVMMACGTQHAVALALAPGETKVPELDLSKWDGKPFVVEEQPSSQKTPQKSQTPQKSAVKTVPATGVTSSQNGGHQEQAVEVKDLLPQTEISEELQVSESKKRSRQEFLEGQQEEPI